MTAAIGDFNRSQQAFLGRVARTFMQRAGTAAPARPLRSYRDPLAGARAQAAFDDVWGRMQAAIDAVSNDPSLSPEARAAALRALRERQRIEAGGARRRIIEDEANAARARRKQERDKHRPSLG
jgi:hypothetical protein